jgi:hypothetical protein
VKEPEALLEKVTMPVGDVGVAEVSVTVAVHIVAWLTATEAGEHVTLVEVVVGTGASEITDTVLGPEFNTYALLVKESTATLIGDEPTVNVSIMLSVAALITET